MLYTCPVCGFAAMTDPPTDHEICEGCGTHFDYDDCNTSHTELREKWIAGGCIWWFGDRRSGYNPFVAKEET